MAPIPQTLEVIEQGSGRPAFKEAMGIVLKLLGNIIKEPANTKYRSFKLENKTIKEKVLSVAGMKAFLLELGFFEKEGSLYLKDSVTINDLKSFKDAIQSRLDSALVQKVDVAATPGPSKVSKTITEGRPKFHGKYSGSPKFTGSSSSHPFLATIDNLLQQVLTYEDEALKSFGRSLVPEEKLRAETLERMRLIQKRSLRDSAVQDPVYEDIFLVVFVEWFSREFFTWVNRVPCKVCGSQEGTRASQSYVENGVRVEEIFCCGQPSKFYRYNDIATLLVTRKGRCGEYANVFTFLCRCMGYDARYIYATFDHVWTEVYSPFQKRWLHVDPSDAVVDSPLMYQHGWKRPIDYVLAISQYDVVDVTWRYCNEDRVALQKRRSRCPDQLFEAKLLAIYKERRIGMSKPKKDYLFKRMLLDSIQMYPIREPTEDERKGRSSGDLEWRKMRGEQSVDAFYVFHLSDEEAESKQFNLRYSAAKDCYETFITGANGSPKILTTEKGWNTRVFSAKNIFRKEEHDWKMVYLARTEDSKEPAVIEWKIDLSSKKMSIKDCQLRFDTKLYEDAKVTLEFVTNTGEVVWDIQKVTNCSVLVIRATLTGGKGDNAWQHSQLFRQESKSSEYPFELRLALH